MVDFGFLEFFHFYSFPISSSSLNTHDDVQFHHAHSSRGHLLYQIRQILSIQTHHPLSARRRTVVAVVLLRETALCKPSISIVFSTTAVPGNGSIIALFAFHHIQTNNRLLCFIT